MDNSLSAHTVFRKHIFLPQDHGSWVFLLSPLAIGLAAGGSLSLASAYLVLAALAAFLIRQPVVVAVKAWSGRRSRRDLPVAQFWIAIYGLVALLGTAGLLWEGFAYVLYLAIPAVPVFALHLYLVSRRAERRQMGVEMVGTGVLALAAPAAYWVGVGRLDPLGWWLFILVWLQSAASIGYAYLRLEQRVLKTVPDLPTRLRMARRALLYTTFNLAAVAVLAALDVLPALLILPFTLQWAESVWGTLNPAVGAKPTHIGVRQLVVSILFTVLFIFAWVY